MLKRELTGVEDQEGNLLINACLLTRRQVNPPLIIINLRLFNTMRIFGVTPIFVVTREKTCLS
jgi:hypothetical protein